MNFVIRFIIMEGIIAALAKPAARWWEKYYPFIILCAFVIVGIVFLI